MADTRSDHLANLANPQVQRSLLGDVIDAAPVLVFVADERMRYVAVNQAACDALGYTREDLLGLSVTDIAVEPEATDLYTDMIRTRSQDGSTMIRARDGALKRYFYNARSTTVAGMSYYVSVGFLEEQLPEALQRGA